MSVLQAFSAEQDGMESYVEKHKLKQTNINPDARFRELTENKALHVSVSRVERSGKEEMKMKMLYMQLITAHFRFYRSKIKYLNCYYNNKGQVNLHQERYQSLKVILLKFKMLKQAFKHSVEDKSATKGDCMYCLERYTKGCPRDLVQSCLHMSANRGFETAKALLQEHFW